VIRLPQRGCSCWCNSGSYQSIGCRVSASIWTVSNHHFIFRISNV